MLTDYADEIKDKVSMFAVVKMYGIEYNNKHKALCPFHNDSRPSMHIYPGCKGYHCFVCNQGGDVIDFVMKLFNLNFHDAIRKMNSDFDLRLPIDRPLSKKEQEEAYRRAKKRKKEIEERQNEGKRLLTVYNAACDRFSALDIIKDWDAPKGPYDEITPQYAYACQHIDAAWEEVQEAAAKLREFKGKENG